MLDRRQLVERLLKIEPSFLMTLVFSEEFELNPLINFDILLAIHVNFFGNKGVLFLILN